MVAGERSISVYSVPALQAVQLVRGEFAAALEPSGEVKDRSSKAESFTLGRGRGEGIRSSSWAES
jgi:hypothetical protein